MQTKGLGIMSKDKEFDQYLNNLDMEDQKVLNAYMDNLNLEDNEELDEYLEHIEEQQNAIAREQVYTDDVNDQSGLRSYIELEPEIESFQDYTTARMKQVDPELYVGGQDMVPDVNVQEQKNDGIADPLQVSLLDEDYEPVVDTIRYKDEEGTDLSEAKNGKNDKHENNPKFSDDILYIDNVTKKSKAPVVIAVILILLVIGGGGYGVYYFTNGFKDFAFLKKEPTTEASTEEITTEATTEEATTEEPVGPYATVDYTLHDPHATDSTIVYDSNSYSLRYPAEEWPIQRDDNGEEREATQEDLYPAITLEPVEGSLNSTNPDPSNVAETQQMTSRYMVLVDLSDDTIVAKRDSDVVVNPASMTKVLTVLTAADMITDLEDTFVMTPDAIKYAYDTGCSAVGFLAGETVTVRDLIYGTIVCSGADAAVGLAQYCCGSQDAFVEKMNQKAEELGISDTAHFTNVVGVYNEDLHCTMEDMAVILSTAMQNDLLRDVLNTRIYQTTPDPNVLPEDVRKELESKGELDSTDITAQDDNTGEGQTDASEETADGDAQDTDQTEAVSEETEQSEGTGEEGEDTTEEIDPGVMLIATQGIQISNWFLRRIEDKDTGGEVLGAKTGFVNAAGFCCASYYKSNSGKEYICVTGDTYSSWRCIYDHVGIYRSLAK